MGALMSSATGAQPQQEYPRLSENLAASQSFEVRKVLHGQVDGLFALPRTRQIVAAAGGYLWKFSAHGELLDTLRQPGALFASGMVFTPHYYVDWVYSGERQRKAYAPAVDGNRLSQAELFAELDRAEQVEFGRNDTAAWAYLLADGKAWMLDITHLRERVDTSCRQHRHSAEKLGWSATCLDGYQGRPRGWSEIEPESFSRLHQASPRVKVVDFDRRRFHLEEGIGGQLVGMTVGKVLKGMGLPGSLPGRYWFGDAHTQLPMGQEVLKFKAFVSKEDGDYRFSNMAWWDPSPTIARAAPWFTVHLRDYMGHAGEEALLPHYEKDIGLYVVRPRGLVSRPADGRPVPVWRPVFDGPSTRSFAVTATVEFAAPAAGAAAQAAAPSFAHLWLRSPEPRKRIEGMDPQVPVEALWPGLQQLPAALTVQWRAPAGQEDTALRIELQAGETQAAFERLRAAKAPLELVLQVPDLLGPTPGMSVLLRSGGAQAPLRQARITRLAGAVGAAGDPAQGAPGHWRTAPSHRAMAEQLQSASRAAQQSASAALPAFLQMAQAMAQDLQQVERLAPDITHAYAELLNHYNGSRDYASSATLVRHYIAQVYPSTGRYSQDTTQVYNVGVIASQTLAFALHTQERDLIDAVLATLIGPGFDPQAQTNGTLMYNLSCYYALASDRPRMLEAVSVARRLGKPSAQFLKDTDFGRYWKDPDFLRALGS